MNNAFMEYINNINDLTEVGDIELDDDRTKKEQGILEYIEDCQRKTVGLQEQKKKVMEQYVSQEISFEDYKTLIAIFNEKSELLESEWQKAQAQLTAVKETASIKQDDITLSIKENWEFMTNGERMMFLQEFVGKIVIKIEKVRPRHNVVKIKDVQFNANADVQKWSRNKLSKVRRERSAKKCGEGKKYKRLHR